MSDVQWESPEVEAEYQRLYRTGWERGADSARNGVERCPATVDVVGSDEPYRCHKAVAHDGDHEDSGGTWNDNRS